IADAIYPCAFNTGCFFCCLVHFLTDNYTGCGTNCRTDSSSNCSAFSIFTNKYTYACANYCTCRTSEDSTFCCVAKAFTTLHYNGDAQQPSQTFYNCFHLKKNLNVKLILFCLQK